MSRFVSLLVLAATATAWIAPVPAGTRAVAHVVPAATRAGRTTSRAFPWPSWPRVPLPHVYSPPSTVSAAAQYVPHATARTRTSARLRP